MNRRVFVLGFAVAAFAIGGLAASASAGDQVPFKGWFDGLVERTGSPPFVDVNVDATGNATHLGQFELAVPHVVHLPTRTATGTYHFTAANGDEVFAEFTGQSTPIIGTDFLYIEEIATITGGTGRFANATGSFTVERLFDTVAGTTTGSFEGTISQAGE
jgi:hypothetical protein